MNFCSHLKRFDSEMAKRYYNQNYGCEIQKPGYIIQLASCHQCKVDASNDTNTPYNQQEDIPDHYRASYTKFAECFNSMAIGKKEKQKCGNNYSCFMAVSED